MLAASDLEPLILADGTRIDPTTGKAVKDKKPQQFIEVPSSADAQALVIKSRKTVAELPLPPAQLGGVALVAFYSLFGLPEQEISLACNSQLSVAQIKEIKKLDAYKEFMVQAKTNILDRAGHRPADIIEHRHKMEDALNIVFTHKNNNEQVPNAIIDVTPKRIDEDDHNS